MDWENSLGAYLFPCDRGAPHLLQKEWLGSEKGHTWKSSRVQSNKECDSDGTNGLMTASIAAAVEPGGEQNTPKDILHGDLKEFSEGQHGSRRKESKARMQVLCQRDRWMWILYYVARCLLREPEAAKRRKGRSPWGARELASQGLASTLWTESNAFKCAAAPRTNIEDVQSE